MSVDIFKLNNVSVSAKEKANVDELTPIRAWPALGSVVSALAQRYPLWHFEVTDVRHNTAYCFRVTEYGEYMGTIECGYHGGNNVICVSNQRIEENMTRGSAYKTTDPIKAVTKIKKMFYRMNVAERMSKANASAAHLIHQTVGSITRELRNHVITIDNAALNFIKSEAGRPVFLEYIQTLPDFKRIPVSASLGVKEQLDARMLTIESVKSKLGKQGSALIVKDVNKYIVHIGTTLNIYDDTTLPLNLRGKLGMLKLVQAEEFVEGVGCKVNAEVFVVLIEEEAEVQA